MTSAIEEYRAHLREAERDAQAHFDKTVLSLSGGALGISFAFLKDVLGPGDPTTPWLLLAAWVAWGLSCTAVLFSFYASHMALRRALHQLESENADDLYTMRPGGRAAVLTAALNAAAGALFFLGLIFMTAFVWDNWR